MQPPFVIVIDAGTEPHFELTGKTVLPDGCDQLFTVAREGFTETPSLFMLPVNSARPQVELLSDYFVALSAAVVFFDHDKEVDHVGVKKSQFWPLLHEAMKKTLRVVMNDVAKSLAEQFGVNKEVLIQLAKQGFISGHDKSCPDKECVAALHKYVMAGGGTLM